MITSRKKKYAKILLILMLLTVSVSIKSYAQDAKPADTATRPKAKITRDLDKVVTTPVRVPGRIIDIPFPVARLTNANYKFDRNFGTGDILAPVPGLFVQSRYGDQEVRLSARGFGSRTNTGTRGVRILLDGIPESEPDGQTMTEVPDLNSIGRIELAKGNASSLYTNAPGGVVNFLNDTWFKKSSVLLFNEYGSSGLHKNGFKAAVKTDKYRLLVTYRYLNFDGYRQHNNEYWHNLNLVMETTLSAYAKLSVLGYFVKGAMKLPGSLTKEEFDRDPFAADPLSVSRDDKRITTRGRLGLRYGATFGRKLNNAVEVTAWGRIGFSEIAAGDYRIINRYGLGLNASYIRKSMLGNRHNEFSTGGDLYTQPARIEYYRNIHGSKGDQIQQVATGNITDKGIYISDNFEILKNRMFALLTARYDNIVNTRAEETLPSRSDSKPFNGFSPKLALDYKLTAGIALYTSFGWSFDAPSADELDRPGINDLFNHDLKPQESQNFELGIKGSLARQDHDFFRRFLYEATLFSVRVDNDIIPYDTLGNIYYRNAARTNRRGIELGAQLEIYTGLTFGVTYTWSDFTYLSYAARSTAVTPLGTYLVTDRDFSGNRMPGVPVNNLYLSLAWSHKVGRHLGIFIKSTCQGISGLWVDDENTEKTKGYNLLNGILGLDMKFGKFTVMASGGVNNIFDEVYVGFTNTNSADRRFYEAGAPRNYFVSVNLGYTF